MHPIRLQRGSVLKSVITYAKTARRGNLLLLTSTLNKYPRSGAHQKHHKTLGNPLQEFIRRCIWVLTAQFPSHYLCGDPFSVNLPVWVRCLLTSHIQTRTLVH